MSNSQPLNQQNLSRVISYIDGFNLYFGLKSKNFKRYYWINPFELSKRLIRDDQELLKCNYFTARVNGDSGRRQATWIDAINTVPRVKCHFGHFLSKTMRCKACSSEWQRPEEKMTDVNIATELLCDAYEDKFDVALIISADSDLTTPIKSVLQTFPQKKVIVVFPPGRHSDQLRQTATAVWTIARTKLRDSQFPDKILSATGHELVRPSNWA